MRKGQAAMEFLMTYGWAILIVVIAVAALAAFGVFNPQRFAQERCVGESTKFACASNTIAIELLETGSSLQLDLRNGAGETVIITGVSPRDSGGSCGTIGNNWAAIRGGEVLDFTNDTLRPNDRFILAVNCSASMNPDGVFDDQFTITYNIEGGVTGVRGTVDAVVKT